MKVEQGADRELRHERWKLLVRLQRGLEIPMIVLAFVWLGMFVVETVWGVHPLLEAAGHVIWGFFWVEFLLGLVLAPHKGVYFRHNWLKALALLAPAMRILRLVGLARAARVARLARAGSGLRLIRLVSSINRGMAALGRTLGRRGVGFAALLSILVTFSAAAGIFAFERDAGTGFDSYGESLWWTAMMMTTMGTENWPATGAGRVLCFLLALYAFAMFGYLTATLASLFIDQDARECQKENQQQTMSGLRAELQELQRILERRLPPHAPEKE